MKHETQYVEFSVSELPEDFQGRAIYAGKNTWRLPCPYDDPEYVSLWIGRNVRELRSTVGVKVRVYKLVATENGVKEYRID